MWPSMQARTTSQSQSAGVSAVRQRALLDWAQASQDNSLSRVEDVVSSSSTGLDSNRRMQSEMQKLARWLEQDESLREDPWKTAAGARGAMSTSPTALEGDMSFGSRVGSGAESTVGNEALGFDDDFTVFVSAPAVEEGDPSGRSTPDPPFGGDSSSTLAPAHAGELYSSLGSVSDLGDMEEKKEVVASAVHDDTNDESDDDLPTEAEIQAASTRIFGSLTTSLSPSETHSSVTATPKPDPFASEKLPSQLDPARQFEGDETDAPYDMAAFDLSRVLSALQEMKAEIAGMDDEGERRRAAAKVALGLVYGLEADTGLNMEPETSKTS